MVFNFCIITIVVLFDCVTETGISFLRVTFSPTLYRLSQKKFRRLEGCGIKSMRPIFKTKMLIYQSKVNLDEKILFDSIPQLTDPEIRKMLIKSMFRSKNSTFHSGPWFFLLLKFEFSISNWQCKLQCHINRGPEWNVEFSIPIQTPYRISANCWVLKMCDFTKQNFLIQVSLWVID